MDKGGLYYANPDGSSVRCVAFGTLGANGVGLSPGGDRVYVAESFTGRLWGWDLEAPGQVKPGGTGPGGGHCLVATKGHFDSLAVEEDGTVNRRGDRSRPLRDSPRLEPRVRADARRVHDQHLLHRP